MLVRLYLERLRKHSVMINKIHKCLSELETAMSLAFYPREIYNVYNEIVELKFEEEIIMKKSTVGILGTIGVAIIGALAFGATARTNNLNEEEVIDK